MRTGHQLGWRAPRVCSPSHRHLRTSRRPGTPLAVFTGGQAGWPGGMHKRQAGAPDRRARAGIVQGQAEVAEVTRREASASVRLRFPPARLQGIQVGASVAINGTCLTVRAQAQPLEPARMHAPAHAACAQITDVQQDAGCFDIIQETLRATNLGRELAVGRRINFERRARLAPRRCCHSLG